MTIYLIDLEAVETRYTSEWKQYLPKQIKQKTKEDTVVISGGEVPQATTPGAFLNFAGTNNYKSQQMLEISTLFANGEVKDGDYFLYTDAWNPTVIQLRYMAELLGVDIRIGGLWHAGSYDPADFLGRLIGDAPWVRHAEKSMYCVFDDNFFATDFHIEMFVRTLFGPDNPWEEDDVADAIAGECDKIKRVGWPMEYLRNSLDSYKDMEKTNTILFPHRIAPEKQPEIFRDLAKSMPEYEWIMCMEQGYTKNDYHNALGTAKLVFSANLQETLGISWYEGLLVDTIPMVPNRLSYSEMAVDEFKYPSEWTESWDKYQEHKSSVIETIHDYMINYEKYRNAILTQTRKLTDNFFSGKQLYNTIKNR